MADRSGLSSACSAAVPGPGSAPRGHDRAARCPAPCMVAADGRRECFRFDFRAAAPAHVLTDAPATTASVSKSPGRRDIDEQLRTEAAGYLPNHVEQLIRRLGFLRLIDAAEETCGEMLGCARVTHLRAAIKQLQDAGRSTTMARGKFWARRILWNGG